MVAAGAGCGGACWARQTLPHQRTPSQSQQLAPACPSPAPLAGDLVQLEKYYGFWKSTRDELDMYERDPHRWLRKHGQFCGLEAQMTLRDKAANVAEVAWPLAVGLLPAFYLLLRKAARR